MPMRPLRRWDRHRTRPHIMKVDKLYLCFTPMKGHPTKSIKGWGFTPDDAYEEWNRLCHFATALDPDRHIALHLGHLAGEFHV